MMGYLEVVIIIVVDDDDDDDDDEGGFLNDTLKHEEAVHTTNFFLCH